MAKLSAVLIFLPALIVGLVIPARAQSSSEKFPNEIEVRGTVGIPSGEANFSGTTDSSQTIDFSRDFNFDNKLGYDIRFIHRSENEKHKFMVEYSRDNWDQERMLTRTFTFRGETFVANAAAEMDVRVRSFLARYAYRWGNEKIRFGPMGTIGVINTSVDLTGTTNNGTRTAEGSITKFAATVGYDLEATPTENVMIFHSLGAIAFQGEHLFHTEGGVKFFPSHHLGVVGGYRFQRYKVEDGDNFITIRAHGPFFGGVFRF
jgi:hypothetical protein